MRVLLLMIPRSQVTCNEPWQAFCGNLAATPPEALRGTLLAGASDVYGQNPGVKRWKRQTQNDCRSSDQWCEKLQGLHPDGSFFFGDPSPSTPREVCNASTTSFIYLHWALSNFVAFCPRRWDPFLVAADWRGPGLVSNFQLRAKRNISNVSLLDDLDASSQRSWMALDGLGSLMHGSNRNMSSAQDQKRFSSSVDEFQKPRFFLMEEGRVTDGVPALIENRIW